MARFLLEEPPLSLEFAGAATADGVEEVEDPGLRLVDEEEVRLGSVVLEEVDREDVELAVKEEVDEVLLDEVKRDDIVVVTVVGFADTTDRTNDRPRPSRLSNSLWLVVGTVGALVVCAQDRFMKR